MWLRGFGFPHLALHPEPQSAGPMLTDASSHWVSVRSRAEETCGAWLSPSQRGKLSRRCWWGNLASPPIGPSECSPLSHSHYLHFSREEASPPCPGQHVSQWWGSGPTGPHPGALVPRLKFPGCLARRCLWAGIQAWTRPGSWAEQALTGIYFFPEWVKTSIDSSKFLDSNTVRWFLTFLSHSQAASFIRGYGSQFP